jgi:hypothetical protein
VTGAHELPIRRSDWALSCLAVILTVVAFAPFALIGIDPHHDGVMLKPALDVLAGQVVFRDTFSQYGVWLHYMQAGILWALGPTLPAMRFGAVAIYGLTAGLLVSAWRLLVPRALVLLALVIWLASPGFYEHWFSLQAWSSVYALLFQAVALRSLLRALLGWKPTFNGVLSGITCGLTFSCRQPVGGVTSAAVIAAYCWGAWASADRHRDLEALAGSVIGLTITLGAELAVLLLSGSLHAWYLQTVDWPRHWAFGDSAPVWNRLALHLLPFPSGTLPWLALAAAALLPLRGRDRPAGGAARSLALAAYVVLLAAAGATALLLDPTHLFRIMWIWTGIPIAILLFTVWSLGVPLLSRRSPSSRDVAAVGAALVALVSWLQYFPAFSPQHIFWSLAPGLGVAMYVAWYASGHRTLATALVVGLLVTPFVTAKTTQARAKLAGSYVRLHGPSVLEGMWVPPNEALEWQRLFESVRAVLRRRPDVPMLVEGRDALFAVLVTNRSNPGPFYVDWRMPGIDLEAERAEFISGQRPLIFQQQAALPLVQQAITAGGYRRIFEGRWGALLEPGAAVSVGLLPPP